MLRTEASEQQRAGEGKGAGMPEYTDLIGRLKPRLAGIHPLAAIQIPSQESHEPPIRLIPRADIAGLVGDQIRGVADDLADLG